MAKWLANSALIAVAYCVAGRLGQLLAVEPNYAAAVWPASGVALAGLLLLGYRVWPGLFLGAMIVNGWTSIAFAENFEAARTAVLVTAVISIGVTLQAVAGRLLIERVIGYPNSLTRDRDILGFLGLGGPVACSIGATWGVFTLHWAGTLEASQLALNWWTWWVGDVVGVLLFAPTVLILFARPRDTWRSRRLSVALPLFVAFVATTIGYIYVQRSEQARTRLQFERRADHAFQDIQDQIAGHLDAVHSIKGFYAGSATVERDEFSIFSRHMLPRHPGIQALSWLPRVPRQRRADFDSRARQEGLAEFGFTERDVDGRLVEVGERDEYFPVFFIEPLSSNEAAVGFDVASHPERKRAMDAACDSGQQVATAPITLVQETADQAGFLVFDPIYDGDMSNAITAERRRALRGYVSGVFRAGDMVEAALRSEFQSDYLLTIRDLRADLDRRIIYSNDERPSPHKGNEVSPLLVGFVGWSKTLSVGGRDWHVEFVPTAGFLAAQSNRHTWLVLASGRTFTGLLGTLLLVLAGRAARVEELVAYRTEELSEANGELEQEVTRREQIEHALSEAHEDLEQRVLERTAALKASESRYLDLYNNAPDMFVSVDMATQRVIECNQTLAAVTGFSRSEIIDRHVYDLYHPRCLDEVRRSFQSFLSTGKTEDLELPLLCADGSVVDVSLNVSAVRDDQGRLVCSRAILRDITAKKQAEARIQDQEAELAHVTRLSTMGELATGLAHEINQPLAAIAAYAEGAAIRIRGGNIDEERLAQVVDRISADAHRAGEIIRRLRTFIHKREPVRTQVDVNELVTDVAHFLAVDTRRRGVAIGFDLADDLPRLYGDAIEIQQVLLNLIRNGFDAMEANEPVDRRLTVRTRVGEDATVEIDVVDRGHGISEGNESQLFVAFFTSKDNGLGMGLAISQSIIESHGGRIWATSNIEGGATFHISLPVAKSG